MDEEDIVLKRKKLDRMVDMLLRTGFEYDEIAKKLGENPRYIKGIKGLLEQDEKKKKIYDEAYRNRQRQLRYEKYLEKQSAAREKAKCKRAILSGLRKGLNKSEIKHKLPNDITSKMFNEEYEKILRNNIISTEEWIEIGKKRKAHRKELRDAKKERVEELNKRIKEKEKEEQERKKQEELDSNPILRLMKRYRKALDEESKELRCGDENYTTERREKFINSLMETVEKEKYKSTVTERNLVLNTIVVHKSIANKNIFKFLIMEEYKDNGIEKAKHIAQRLGKEFEDTEDGKKLKDYGRYLEKFIDPVHDKIR